MIHVEGKRVTLDGRTGHVIGEAGGLIDVLAKNLAEDLGADYEAAVQIIIESIYRGCMASRGNEKRKDR